MGRFGLAIAASALLLGTAAHAQVIDVTSSQGSIVYVDGDVPIGTFNASGSYSPNGVGIGASGGSFLTSVVTTPSTVSFEASNAVSGGFAAAYSATAVNLSFTAANNITDGVLHSSITPAGLGFYAADLRGSGGGLPTLGLGNFAATDGPRIGGCLYTSCPEGVSSLGQFVNGNFNGETPFAEVGVRFKILRGETALVIEADGLDEGVTEISGTMRIYYLDGGAGYFVDSSEITGNLGFLDGFRLSTEEGSITSFGFAWDGKDIDVHYGDFLAGEQVNLTYLTEVTSISRGGCASGSFDCLIAYAGFGDPIGRGGDIDSLDASAFTLDDDMEWLNATNPISGLNFGVATFNRPTIDANGDITFALVPTAVPEPASWAMMILGFGVMGAALRRRRLLGAHA